MKKLWTITVLAALLLSGCAAETYETVDDYYSAEADAQVRQILLDLPKEAAAPAMESSGGEQLYLCDGYELRIQTILDRNPADALQEVSGCPVDALTVIQTADGDCQRYESVWCTAGEAGTMVGRTAVIDDGANCYCITVLAEEETAGQLQESWQHIFDSFTLG